MSGAPRARLAQVSGTLERVQEFDMASNSEAAVIRFSLLYADRIRPSQSGCALRRTQNKVHLSASPLSRCYFTQELGHLELSRVGNELFLKKKNPVFLKRFNKPTQRDRNHAKNS